MGTATTHGWAHALMLLRHLLAHADRRMLAAGLACAMSAGVQAQSAPPAPSAPSARTAKPAGCLIEPSQVAEVGSAVTGVLDTIDVQLGDTVSSGQVLAVLRGDVERANAGVAAARSQVDADVRAAAANVELARQKVVRARQLVGQNFISQQALDQAQAEAEVAEQKLNQARAQQKISWREWSAAQAQLGQRTLRSPLDGIVVERYANPGERVEDRPVLRVATIDPLRVELMVPVAQYGSLAIGDSVTVRTELPNTPPLAATVQYVDKVVDAASNSFRVRLALPNPAHRIPAGLRCKAELPGALAQKPKAPAPERVSDQPPLLLKSAPSLATRS